MAAFEAALSVYSLYSYFPCYSSKFFSSPNRPLPSNFIFPILPLPFPSMSHFPLSGPRRIPTRKLRFELLCSAVEEITEEKAVKEEEEETAEKSQQQNQKRKLYVVNLPWSLTVVDIKNLFGECGTVKGVEIIKQQNGMSRGFAFVTLDSGEEAQAAIDKFHSHEVLGRTIRIEFAKQFKKPSPLPPNPQVGETRYKLYVSNLGWKEEAEAAISSLQGKELMDRSINLKFSEKNIGDFGSQKEEEDRFEGQPEELQVHKQSLTKLIRFYSRL